MKKSIKGRNNYGQAIGILMVDTVIHRPPGDIGNASTFDFPIVYKTVKGCNPDNITKGDPVLIQPFIDAALELQAQGVRAITTSCGFAAIYQKEIARSLEIPFFSSSLMQVRLAYRMMKPDKKVGILTFHSDRLTDKFFEGVDSEDIPRVVAGMQGTYFGEVFKDADVNVEVNFDQVRKELVDQAKKMVEANPDIGAIILECTNMPPYAKSIQNAVGLPVFDIVTLINFICSALLQKEYSGFM